MATGPEHYREAEKLLDYLKAVERGDDHETSLLAEAQIHATLALVAATALPHVGEMKVPDCEAWEAAVSLPHIVREVPA